MNDQESRFLIFAVAGEKYALALQDVEEIMELPEIHPLPIAPLYYSGVMNCHGTPMPILDLAAYYRKAQLDPGSKILVLHRKIANLALRVHTVYGIVQGAVASGPGEDSSDSGDILIIVGDGKIKLLGIESLLLLLEEEVNSR